MNLMNEDLDPLFGEAVDYVATKKYTSADDLKEHFNIGYNRSAMLLEQMEEMGIVSWESDNGIIRYRVIIPLASGITGQVTKEFKPNSSSINAKQGDSKILGYDSFEWIMACIAFIIILVIFVSCSGKSPSPKEDYCSDDKMAYIYAEKLISSNLKSPSSAKFASYYDVKSTQLEDCKFNFVGYVDAQNSFGAMIRTKFSVTVRYDQNKDTYYLERLDM
ncbi:hypothetical protein GPY57_00110 [Photorhabdus laumondii subsp. laumondii]|nr:hypothetical protein [Photorhabdus laumondii subsp. laumondii]